jgi:trk system potassium uptake protein TrkA
MSRNVVIVGGGRVGRHTAEQLSTNMNTVTVVELNAERCEQLSPRVTTIIQGDGTDTAVLERAGVTEADVVAALTDDTRVNLEVCETAAEMNEGVRTILRIAHDGEQDYGHRRFVDDVVYPAAAGAEVAVERISRS